MSSEFTLPLLHFNDVYRVTPQKLNPSKPSETIDVTQFAALVNDLRDRWPLRPDGGRDGLLLFSGDVFSPSMESSVTRGSHMVPVLNELAVDVTVPGNHDFDFGYPHLSKLIGDTTFPWVLSNIIDTHTSKTPEHLQEFLVIERAGIRIGIIGLVEQEWITTVSAWPPNFVYKSMTETGIALSQTLRDPKGKHRCDIIIALTHSRLPNDIQLAKELFAYSPSSQESNPIASNHGVDILLGGHDHIYYAGPGVTSWDNYDVHHPILGSEGDHGDVLVVKSGTDFRDLSEINLILKSTPEGSVRSKVISRIIGKRHEILPGSKSSESMSKLLKTLLSSVSSALKAPLCRTTVEIDVHSSYIRTTESPICNWISDIARHAYDEALYAKGYKSGSDGVLFCAGTFRGDSSYGPGLVTMGDILEILPFEDAIVVVEVDGEMLWDALESSLKTWPSQEGRFPSISGFRVSWDSRREPGSRVLGVWLLVVENNHIREEPVTREKGGRLYAIVTREYMAEGHDGFEALTRAQVLVNHECGSLLSTIVRKYLLGSQFVNKVLRLQEPDRTFINESTRESIVALERDNSDRSKESPAASAVNLWKHALHLVHRARTSIHYRNNMKIANSEHMSSVDAFDGAKARKGEECGGRDIDDVDVMIVTPIVDGRLVNEGVDPTVNL